MEIAISYNTALFILVGFVLLVNISSFYRNTRPLHERYSRAMNTMSELENAFGDKTKLIYKVTIYIIGLLMISFNLIIGYMLQVHLIIAALAVIFSISYLITTFILINRLNKGEVQVTDRFPWISLLYIIYLPAVLLIIGF
jgi:hypothetical protein